MSLLQRELAKIREALLEETDTLLLHSMHPTAETLDLDLRSIAAGAGA